MVPVEWHGNDVRIHPAGAVRGEAVPPGSKSLTNRYLACAALADGHSVLRGVSLSDDAHAMLAGLSQLGVWSEVRADRREITIIGCKGHLPADEAELDVGHAGTAMRFLAGLACLGFGQYRLDGSPRMRARPIGALVEALRALGAHIGYDNVPGYPPLNILARGLAGGEVAFDTPPSSQFISALLMAAPYARQDVMIRIDGPLVSRPYVDMTIDVMRSMGVEVVASEGRRFIVPAQQRYQPGEFTIEPDASAAGYLWTAGAVTGGRVRVRGLTRNSRQGDTRFVDVLARMGCVVDEDGSSLAVAAPADGRLTGISIDLNDMPDTVQTLAVAALFADGPTEVRNVANLRVKETDRLAALGAELGRLGARVALRADGLTIHPPARITPAEIRTYDDHRMAMSFALAGLVVEGIVIKDAGCVSKSFPDFFEVLSALGGGTRNTTVL
ncbi:MAG: 3-phosphoshikimate 1-carboxyvinyltransferase [Phycisphaerae bacterium]|nr:3-phosphoshikimate 1-carboxyvinyltransferase [Phycisphaerae bacterium]